MANKPKAIDGFRVCTMCGDNKPVEDYRTRKYDQRFKNSYCRKCENKKANLLAREKRDKLDRMRLEKGCIDCGYKEHAAALDFDHLPIFEKAFTISAGVMRFKWETILAEIEKCEVVCANCHRIRTLERRQVIL